MNYENSEKLKSMKILIRQKTFDIQYMRRRVESILALFMIPCIRHSLLFSSFMLISSISQAQVLRLDSVIQVIKERNPMLQDFRHRTNAMNAYSAGAKSWMAPEVGGGLWMVPYKKVEDVRDKGQIMLSVQQKFTHPTKLKASKEYMESKSAIEIQGELIAYNELRSQAKAAYYQWIVLEKKKKVIQVNEGIIKLMINIAKLRNPHDQSNIGNVYKAEGRLYEVKNMMLMNENEIHVKRTIINQLMNIPIDSYFEIDTLNSLPAFVYQNVDTSLFISSRSDIRRIDKRIQSMKLNQVLERQQTKPDFNLSFNHMIPRGAGMPSQFMLLGMLSIPIAPWSSKMYKSNVLGMELEIKAMRSERESILNELHGMTIAMISEIQMLLKQIENFDKHILPALHRNYESTMLAYEENEEELPMVINA